MQVKNKQISFDGKANIYTIQTDNDDTVHVVKQLYDGGIKVVEEVSNPREIIGFLYKDSAFADDFRSYGVRRQHKSAYAPVVSYCYSKEQALYIADQVWNGVPDGWYFFEVFCDKDVIIKDYLKGANIWIAK